MPLDEELKLLKAELNSTQKELKESIKLEKKLVKKAKLKQKVT